MKTIIVDHDSDGEVPDRGRFNAIIPLLKSRGLKDIYKLEDVNEDSGIIRPAQLPQYLDTAYKIIYAHTTKIPHYDYEVSNDKEWLFEISTDIPRDIIELANAGRLHIAYFVGEIITIPAQDIISETWKQLEKAGINSNAITVYVPNFQVPESGRRPVKFISIFEMSYYASLVNFRFPLIENVIQTVNLEPRSKKFTCLNHWNKTHRLCIAASLYNAGLHEQGYFSYHDHPLCDGEPAIIAQNLETEEFESKLPFLLDTNCGETVNEHWLVKKPFFTDAYWNFVTESFFADYYALTEKTFKPIVNLQPFIIFGAPGSLKELHNLGYKTFSSVIDESYDLETDHDKRMEKLINLAIDLVQMSDEQHIQLMKLIKPILEHNQQVFFSKGWQEFL